MSKRKGPPVNRVLTFEEKKQLIKLILSNVRVEGEKVFYELPLAVRTTLTRKAFRVEGSGGRADEPEDPRGDVGAEPA